MAGLIPFNKKNNTLSNWGYDSFDFIDDFFNERWLPSRNLMNDTFKIDVKETEKEYLIEAELPGIQKDEVALNLDDGKLCISVNREENINEEKEKYIHRERRYSSMTRSVYLADSIPDNIKAKLDNGILSITVQKEEKLKNSHKIEIE